MRALQPDQGDVFPEQSGKAARDRQAPHGHDDARLLVRASLQHDVLGDAAGMREIRAPVASEFHLAGGCQLQFMNHVSLRKRPGFGKHKSANDQKPHTQKRYAPPRPFSIGAAKRCGLGGQFTFHSLRHDHGPLIQICV